MFNKKYGSFLMKNYGLLALSVLAFCGCTHSSDSSTPAPVVITRTGGNYSTSGAAGGTCTPALISDYRSVSTDCSDTDFSITAGGAMSESLRACIRARSEFAAKYPDADCSFDDQSGAHVTIKNSTNRGSQTEDHDGNRDGDRDHDRREDTQACADRAREMRLIEADGQRTLERATHAGFQGDTPPSSFELRSEVSDFKARYGDLRCDGESTRTFEEQMKREMDEIDQFQ
jgi:hypothetical protein